MKAKWILTITCAFLLGPPSNAQDGTLTDQHRLLMDYYQDSFGLATDPGPRLFEMIASERMLAKAQPDECYTGVGGIPTQPPCFGPSQEKVNEAYVWGLTKSGDRLWFGTAPNVHCLVMGGYLGLTNPVETPSYVCEFGSSALAKSIGLPAEIGDFRPPHAYIYDLSGTDASARLQEIQIPDPGAAIAFSQTLGIRSAGSNAHIVFLAGPALSASGV